MSSNSFTVRLKILTPVHIGSGETVSILDYFLEAGQLCRVDIAGLFSDPDFVSIKDKFLQSAASGQAIDKLLPKELLRKHILYRIPVSPSARNTNQIEVRLFIQSAGRVYIPGSSLKGAILAALCYDVLKQSDYHTLSSILEGWEKENRRGKKTREYEDPLNIVLPALIDAGDLQLKKFTRWLDVTDSDFKNPSDALELSLARVIGARRGVILVLYETLRPGITFNLTLRIPPQSKLTPETLLERVNEFYRKVLEKDRQPTDVQVNSSRVLIRLGQGSGMFATALLILAQELNLTHIYRLPKVDTRIGPRTRKRIGSTPMGWAELEVV